MDRIGGPARAALQDANELADKAVTKARGRGGEDKGPKKAARGRQDRSGQEKVIDIGALKQRMGELTGLHAKAKEAGKKLSDAIKATAEKSGLLATVVRKAVAAKASENFDEKKKEAEQLELVFGELKG